MTSQTPTSIADLEADIAARRERLAATIDELTTKAAPSAVLEREKEKAKVGFVNATTHPDGSLRVDRIAIAAGVVVGIIAIRVIRARRARRRKRFWE